MSDVKGLLTPASHLAAHIFVGTTIFCIVAIAAFGLQKLVHLLESNGTDATIITVLTIVEHLTFYVDMFCYVVMLLGAAFVFVREIAREVGK
ncbi:hypothetical protein ABH905_004268 [Pseudomonas frederiksbergensis]|uniref:hypothetical protein n=1 Tax=Pseudomonas frederiksbergensis TaxID=104087 RepID=UPI003D20A6E8